MYLEFQGYKFGARCIHKHFFEEILSFEMSQFGHVSAVNLRGQSKLNNLWSSQSWRCYCLDGKMNTLSFASSDAMGRKLKSPSANAFMTRSRKDVPPLKVWPQRNAK